MPAYGSRRITAELRRQGWVINRKRVQRMMRQDNLLCLRHKKFIPTTDSEHGLAVYPNFVPTLDISAVNQLWGANITYIRLLRLMELYVGASVDDDTILEQHEYVYLAKVINGRRTFLKFATLPNLFCAQGDRRWWHDHRTPGGIMITSNALGHFMHCVTDGPEPDCRRALKQAMMTIQNSHRSGNRRLRQPATALGPRGEGELTPLEGTSFDQYSPHRYRSYFHTDHLIRKVAQTRSKRKTEQVEQGEDVASLLTATVDAQSNAQLEPCPGGGYDPVPVEIEVAAVPIVVESTTERQFGAVSGLLLGFGLP